MKWVGMGVPAGEKNGEHQRQIVRLSPSSD